METKSVNNNFNQIDVLESQILSKFNEGNKTFDALSNSVQFSEQTLTTVLSNLVSKNVFKFNISKKEYEYVVPLKDETIVLDGNFMLPTTIIRRDDCILISRGEWYKFDKDFDVRRIIWNVVLPDNKNSTLVNLIKESAVKVRKIKNVQLPEYKKLVSLLIPYSSEIKFEILCVGEEKTDVSIMFIDSLPLDSEGLDFYAFKQFQVRSEIDTDDLINQLTVDISQRNFKEIKINRIYNFSEFVYKGNCIPLVNNKEVIEYVKINSVKSSIQLTFIQIDSKTLKERKVDEEIYTDISEGIEKLKTLFKTYAEPLLNKADFMVEYE